MQYVEISYGNGNLGYQEIYAGNVQRYTDLSGNTITIPANTVCSVANANPAQPSWALPDPVVVAAAPAPTPINALAFRNRFTQAEKVAIYTAAATNVEIKVWLDDIAVAGDVDLSNPETQAGVQALEASGLIATGRAAVILNA